MVRDFPRPILGILCYVHLNSPLIYLIFFMCLILNKPLPFVSEILSWQSCVFWISLISILRISPPKQYSFLIKVKMVSMFHLGLMPCQFIKFIGLLAYLPLLIFGIVDWVIVFPVCFIFLVSINKICCLFYLLFPSFHWVLIFQIN
jgi:hypothetical protein